MTRMKLLLLHIWGLFAGRRKEKGEGRHYVIVANKIKFLINEKSSGGKGAKICFCKCSS